ncbi:MAG: ubiquitin-like domain-containing protein, partial [Firmicutes bacterium]|nr:ubiquitin-like domain-containing protein [Bacillota bacterium]
MDWCVLRKAHMREGRDLLKPPRKRGVLFLWAALGALAVVLLLSGYAWAKKSVVLVVDGKETAVNTFARTVDGLLKAQNVAILEKDELAPPLGTSLKDGMVVSVNHAVEIAVKVDGEDLVLRTRSQTVGAVLEEYGIDLGPEDEVTPSVDAAVTAGARVHVARVRTESETLEAPVDYETQKQYTTKLPNGST